MPKESIDVVSNAAAWLRSQNATPKILIKQTRNLGDTLHITPIARHYKTKYPGSVIAFITGDRYASAHQFNKDFDKIFTVPADLNPQQRIKLGEYIKTLEGIDYKLCPSIHPFGAVWITHRWSNPVISHQYFLNAQINLHEMVGDKKLHVPLVDEDVLFAREFVGGKRVVALEYCSYSCQPRWLAPQFEILAAQLKAAGYTVLSLAGSHEGIIAGTADGRGIPWRRTTAILAHCVALVGVGSGITMLAAAAKPQPKIFEIDVSDSITMKSCGYADSIALRNIDPAQAAGVIKKVCK